jgi:hypothetical protein
VIAVLGSAIGLGSGLFFAWSSSSTDVRAEAQRLEHARSWASERLGTERFEHYFRRGRMPHRDR